MIELLNLLEAQNKFSEFVEKTVAMRDRYIAFFKLTPLSANERVNNVSKWSNWSYDELRQVFQVYPFLENIRIPSGLTLVEAMRHACSTFVGEILDGECDLNTGHQLWLPKSNTPMISHLCKNTQRRVETAFSYFGKESFLSRTKDLARDGIVLTSTIRGYTFVKFYESFKPLIDADNDTRVAMGKDIAALKRGEVDSIVQRRLISYNQQSLISTGFN